jgi:hypothetical protein
MIRPALIFLLAASAAWGADAIYINGNVITVDPSKPYAEAFAVINGRFSAVGTTAEIRRLATPATRVVDLKGMTVTPGFNDVHLHPVGMYDENSPYYVPWLGPETVHNMDDLIAALKKKASHTPHGQRVTGAGYQDTKLGRYPNRHDLDQASTEHPISITSSAGHIQVVNTYVLEHSGITKDTPDPPGGSFDRDPDGMPNGVIRGNAGRLLARPGAADGAPRIPFAEQVQGFLRCFRGYAERGNTSVGIAGGSPQTFRLYQAVREAGNPVRVAFMFSEASFSAVKSLGLSSGFGDDFLRFTSLKVFHGNSMSGRTCWLSEPYSDQPGYYGIPPTRSQEDLDKAFQAMHDAGFQIATHANGDREIDMVLTAIERAQAKNPRPDARHRIEHASVMTQSLLERAKKAGVILVFHSYMWEHGDKLESYGEKRLAMIHPYRSAIDMGIHVAGHSDAEVSAPDPLLRIQDMVTRKGENGKGYGVNQRVSVEEAIKVWTLDGAYATFEEKSKGSIAPGKLADFAVLRKDPRKVDPDTIKDIVVDSTYVGGERVWLAAPNAKVARRLLLQDEFYGDGTELENYGHDREF